MRPLLLAGLFDKVLKTWEFSWGQLTARSYIFSLKGLHSRLQGRLPLLAGEASAQRKSSSRNTLGERFSLISR